MKKLTKILSAVALAVATVFSVSCSKNSGRILYLYNWTYYTPDDVIKAFEKEFDCTVKLDSYSTCDEMYAKLRAGAKGYDVVIPSNDFVSIMLKQGMLRELDQSKMTNRDKINPVVQAKMDFDPEMKYAVPYALSATGVMVNKTKVSGSYARDYSIFSDPQFAGHATMMDEMREVIGCALVHKGYNMNSVDDSELNDAYRLISSEWKPNLTKFDAEGFGKSFASGDFWLCQGYPEIVYGEVDESRWADTIDFFIPPEGGPATLDCMVILKDAPHYELANEFINFIHRPEMYAKFIDTFRYPCVVNTEALNYVTKQPMYNAEQAYTCTLKQDLGDNLDKYHDIWQKIRFAD
ncbi:MAG: extracellular solute-binding protein [Treponema sp.]|nr:extracellular solute-binding protein [Treponema sp.]MBR6192666.1 extracellular solute-binding protein [Treponema sp.]